VACPTTISDSEAVVWMDVVMGCSNSGVQLIGDVNPGMK
jgi:hypothetical protein